MIHPSFRENIEKWWKKKVIGTTKFKLTKKLDEVKKILKKWNNRF